MNDRTHCGQRMHKEGHTPDGRQRWYCPICGCYTTDPMITKYFLGSDYHTPLHDEKTVRAQLAYLRHYRPDKIVLMGDVGEFASVCHWLEHKPLLQEGLRFGNDLAAVSELLGRFSEAAPGLNKEDKILLMGNHEDWARQYVVAHPPMEGIIDLREWFEKQGWTVIEPNVPLDLGCVLLLHETFINEFHAKKAVLAYGNNVIYGHTHDVQEYTAQSFIGPRVGMSIGCGCNMNPRYLRNRTKRWAHACATMDVHWAGKFWVDLIKVSDGMIIRNGKIYGGES